MTIIPPDDEPKTEDPQEGVEMSEDDKKRMRGEFVPRKGESLGDQSRRFMRRLAGLGDDPDCIISRFP